MTEQVLCGCKKHPLDGHERSAYYKSEWWNLKCLFRIADPRFPRLLDKLEDAIASRKRTLQKLVRMKRFIRKQPCSLCCHPAGNRFVFDEDNKIICQGCWRGMAEHTRGLIT